MENIRIPDKYKKGLKNLEKLIIITGHFGSGKSEIAMNLSKKLRKEGEKVVLVDIDIVNPYFCIRDFRDELQAEGIELVSASPHLSNAELMVVPRQVSGAFYREDSCVIMDIGGDDMGAIVLGQYNAHVKDKPYEMYFVVNTLRPLTSDGRSVMEFMESIERSSRLKVTKLISNTNMSYETTAEDIISGEEKVFEISEATGLPVAYTVVRRDLVDEVKGRIKGEILPIDIYMKPPWR